jgi:SAM-dependent methyltransferase
MSQGQEWWEKFWSERAPDAAGEAPEADTWHDLIWRVGLEHWYDVFSEQAPGRRMLECGCGSARVSQYMAARGFDCWMLDYSDHGIRLARAGFNRRSLKGRFVVGDLHQLPFPDARSDIVYCAGVLEFFADIQRPISEMVRVLRPGGVFSANVVPRKFSIQTVADIERTIAHLLRNLMLGRVKEAFRVVRAVPGDYHLNPAHLREYVVCCEDASLRQVTGLGTSPFPALALPAFGPRLYARTMKALLPQWRRFDRSRGRWTEIWGITYTIYGVRG